MQKLDRKALYTIIFPFLRAGCHSIHWAENTTFSELRAKLAVRKWMGCFGFFELNMNILLLRINFYHITERSSISQSSQSNRLKVLIFCRRATFSTVILEQSNAEEKENFMTNALLLEKSSTTAQKGVLPKPQHRKEFWHNHSTEKSFSLFLKEMINKTIIISYIIEL